MFHFSYQHVLIHFGQHFRHNQIDGVIEEPPEFILLHGIITDGPDDPMDVIDMEADFLDISKTDFQPKQ